MVVRREVSVSLPSSLNSRVARRRGSILRVLRRPACRLASLLACLPASASTIHRV